MKPIKAVKLSFTRSTAGAFRCRLGCAPECDRERAAPVNFH